MENPIKMDDLGKHPIFGNIQMGVILTKWGGAHPPRNPTFDQAGLVGHDAPERRAVAWACRPPAAWQERSGEGRDLKSAGGGVRAGVGCFLGSC